MTALVYLLHWVMILRVISGQLSSAKAHTTGVPCCLHCLLPIIRHVRSASTLCRCNAVGRMSQQRRLL